MAIFQSINNTLEDFRINLINNFNELLLIILKCSKLQAI